MPGNPRSPFLTKLNWGCFAFALLSFLAQRSAHAQAASAEPQPTAGSASENTEARRADAQVHFQRGLELAQAGQNWESALAEFLEARRLYPRFSATRNAGFALRQLGRYTEAIAMYDALLSEFMDSIPQPQLEQFRSERAALLSYVGELTIDSAAPGTRVVIDGQERSSTPLPAPIRLDMGVHTVRLSKDGYQTVERQVAIPGNGRRSLNGRLDRLFGIGTLAVEEDAGEALDVLIDAAVVGQTPYRGNVAAGVHSVLLRAPGRGTPPTAVEVKEAQTATLRLHAIMLDANVTVEPKPESSTVFVDGVFVGNGAWNGALPHGLHRFQVVAPDYLPFSSDVELKAGETTGLKATLTRNHLRIEAQKAKPIGLYVEPEFGLLFAHSLRGDGDSSCGCEPWSHPFGWQGSVRLGYSLKSRFGVELTGGYLSLTESFTRTVKGSADGNDLEATDFHQQITLAGPFAALGASARLGRRFPITARASAGLAFLTARSTARGTFAGRLPNSMTNRVEQFQESVSIPEETGNLLTPFVSSELRVGYRLTNSLSADLGMALQLFLPPKTVVSTQKTIGDSTTGFHERLLTLSDERLARAFIAFAPSVAVRYEF